MTCKKCKRGTVKVTREISRCGECDAIRQEVTVSCSFGACKLNRYPFRHALPAGARISLKGTNELLKRFALPSP